MCQFRGSPFYNFFYLGAIICTFSCIYLSSVDKIYYVTASKLVFWRVGIHFFPSGRDATLQLIKTAIGKQDVIHYLKGKCNAICYSVFSITTSSKINGNPSRFYSYISTFKRIEIKIWSIEVADLIQLFVSAVCSRIWFWTNFHRRAKYFPPIFIYVSLFSLTFKDIFGRLFKDFYFDFKNFRWFRSIFRLPDFLIACLIVQRVLLRIFKEFMDFLNEGFSFKWKRIFYGLPFCFDLPKEHQNWNFLKLKSDQVMSIQLFPFHRFIRL